MDKWVYSSKSLRWNYLFWKKIHLIFGNLASYHDNEIMRIHLFKIEQIYTSGEHHDEKRPVVVNKLYALCLRGMLMAKMAFALYRDERICCRVQVFSLILHSSVSLSASIQSASDLVSGIPGSNPAFSRGTQLVSFRFEYRLLVPERRN